MKIAIVGTRGVPNNYGGFEQFAQYLSKGLVKKGCNVYVYNSHNHPYKKSEWQGVNIIHKYDPEYLIGLSGQFIYDFNCITDSRKRGFDIILQLGYTTNSIWHFLLPRHCVRICNPDGMEHGRSKYPKIVKKFLKFAEQLAVKSNHAIIADSKVIRDYYKNNYKKEIFYVAYPAKIFEYPAQKILSKYGLKSYKYNMLTARLQKDNNIETIIRGTVESYNNFPLLVIGAYENKYGKYLRKKYKDKRIIFLNSIYNIDILNNLRFYSNIYFHGHSAGGTNPSLLEAMASSAFIMAHNNPYNKDVLKENALFFENSKDITKILNNNLMKNDYQNMIENNKKIIKNNYSEQKIISEYYSVFKKYYKIVPNK